MAKKQSDTTVTAETSADGTKDAPGNQLTVNLADVAQGLASEMPEVQEHAVSEAVAQQQAAEAAPRDKAGALFDPAVHIAGADGKPQLTVRGTFAMKRGRKAGSATSVASSTMGNPQQNVQNVQNAQQAASEQAARVAGIQAAELLIAAGVILGGEEWHPRRDEKIGLDERAMLQGAMGEYFVASGKTDIPPGTALCFVVLAYAAPRFAMPKTQSRFRWIKEKLITWYVSRKLRKQGLTQSNTREGAQ